MSRLLRIAGREYVAFVKTVGFWLSMLMMPVILTVTGLAPIVMMRSTPPPTIMVVDADFAAKRQRFLAEQGYAYSIVDADDLLYG